MKFKGFETTSGGIYAIRNVVNGKVYIGRTKNFKRRYKQYLYDFSNDRYRSVNKYLLKSYKKYGEDNFEFEPIFYCFTESESIVLEVEFMKKFNSLDREFGYNLRCDSDGGMTVSKSTSEKISNRLKSEWNSGIRDGHSEKLKKSWDNRDRDEQSKLMSKNLTKWVYYINSDFSNPLLYKDLKEMGMRNVISSFGRVGSDDVVYKGIAVCRKSAL